MIQIISVHIPTITESKENFVGNFEYKELLGWENGDNNLFHVYQNSDNSKYKKRVLPENDYKEINVYNAAGHLLEDGPYTFTFSSGDTSYGSRTFATPDGKKPRIYRLYKYHNTQDIQYHEKVAENKKWKYLQRYKFDKTNFTWKNKL